MADRGDTHYHVPTLNLWFAGSSLLLLVVSVWMVLDDWNAPWKKYQREFREIEIDRAERALADAGAQAALEAEKRALEELERVRADVRARQDELAAAREKLFQLRGAQFTATEAAKKAKQNLNWEIFQIEEHRAHEGDPDYGQERLVVLQERLLALTGEQQEADLAVQAQQERIADLEGAVIEAENAVKTAAQEIELTRRKLETLDPDDAPTQIANVIRDFPGLDFIGPSLAVQKVVLENLTFELNFTKKQRIDMCMTCHVAIDSEGYVEEDLEQPFRSHPRLDLFLLARSPHPMSEFGCTICHRGGGESLHFVRADHRPTDLEEEMEWHDEYHWHKQHHWDYPMLSSGYVEASCVQCHQDSMELIADDAPRVTEGYRDFERFGCYSCHKVSWFPTERRPGPSLKAIAAKTDPDWIASWVSDPKAFRPTTWMPQFFYLENFPADGVIAHSEYGQGRDIVGQEWNDALVASVTEFLLDRSSREPFPPMPVEGDPEAGRETFRLVGCLACHNVAPYEGEPEDTIDLAFERRGENEHGPNLRGVATKVNPEWLFAWLKDPSSYWDETRMPDLRLTDQEAADIVAYMMEDPNGIFRDVPDGWEPAPKPYEMDVLREMARWLYSRTPRSELGDRFEGRSEAHRWDRPQDLLVDVGEQWVRNQGCFSCHEIEGLEDANPIGTELTTWGSKTVDKLDWAFMADELALEKHLRLHGREPAALSAAERDEVAEEEWDDILRVREELKNYREPWLEQKLREPRSFDRGKVKNNPLDRLRMPSFDFTEEEIEAISTFVVGLVDDEVQRALMVPTADQASLDEGLQGIRRMNCESCHVIDPGRVTFRGEDGGVHEVMAELLPLEEELLPPSAEDLEALKEHIATYEEDFGYEVEEVGIRLLGTYPDLVRRDETSGRSGDNLFVPTDAVIGYEPSRGGDFVRLVTDYYFRGIEMYDGEADEYWGWTSDPSGEGAVLDVDGEHRYYGNEPYDKVRWTFAPPVLLDEGHKLQKPWFHLFLNDPLTLRHQLRVRMPTFPWSDADPGAIVEAFSVKAKQFWPSRYARELRASTGQTAEELAEAAGLDPSVVRGIEEGLDLPTTTGLPSLLAHGDSIGFSIGESAGTGIEHVEVRTPSHLDERVAAHPEIAADGGLQGWLKRGFQLAAEGPQCFQCHFQRGEAPLEGAAQPLAWAPDLYLTRDRLREAWVKEWLADPGRIYPGTAMPANFLPGSAQYQDIYPDSNHLEQIRLVVDWLFNMDRVEN